MENKAATLEWLLRATVACRVMIVLIDNEGSPLDAAKVASPIMICNGITFSPVTFFVTRPAVLKSITVYSCEDGALIAHFNFPESLALLPGDQLTFFDDEPVVFS